METIKILVGSRRFFTEDKLRKGANADTDYVELNYNQTEPFLYRRENGTCVFSYNANLTKEELIHWHLHENEDPMNVCSLIIPEVCEHYGLSVKELEPIFFKARYASKKPYAIIIYDKYWRNNAFELSQEQLNEVHQYYIGEKRLNEYEFGWYENIKYR